MSIGKGRLRPLFSVCWCISWVVVVMVVAVAVAVAVAAGRPAMEFQRRELEFGCQPPPPAVTTSAATTSCSGR
ncbi:hypothetical protein O9K51_07282 [Purpureocillium lavendulum]|uniref:Uncharacterized protein n=1 Tax=Purpureocillium lavendulum TaxID=1247861 RepID=A0AB34FLU8_9HYPO|nr:hypothetical protein O9K51_07282 [Purpureocillium lavendulum]